jgi:hypothetical protein
MEERGAPMTTVTLDQVIDSAMQLPPDQQEMLVTRCTELCPLYLTGYV